MPAAPVELSVLIVTHQSRREIGACLQALREHSPTASHEVIVVDNASTDGTPQVVAQEPGVELIRRPSNDGFSVASNVAAARARGAFVLLLNPDTVVTEGALDRMLEFMRRTPRAGIAGCRLVDETGQVSSSAGDLPGLRMQLVSWLGLRTVVPARIRADRRAHSVADRLAGRYHTSLAAGQTPRRVRNVSGACMLIRHSLLEQTGSLDEGFFLYLEDADLCRRAAERGWELYFLPGATVVHRGGASFAARSGGMSYRHSPERARSAIRYFQKHGGTLPVLLMRGIILLGTALRLPGPLLRGDRRTTAMLLSIIRLAATPGRCAH